MGAQTKRGTMKDYTSRFGYKLRHNTENDWFYFLKGDYCATDPLQMLIRDVHQRLFWGALPNDWIYKRSIMHLKGWLNAPMIKTVMVLLQFAKILSQMFTRVIYLNGQNQLGRKLLLMKCLMNIQLNRKAFTKYFPTANGSLSALSMKSFGIGC